MKAKFIVAVWLILGFQGQTFGETFTMTDTIETYQRGIGNSYFQNLRTVHEPKCERWLQDGSPFYIYSSDILEEETCGRAAYREWEVSIDDCDSSIYYCYRQIGYWAESVNTRNFEIPEGVEKIETELEGDMFAGDNSYNLALDSWLDVCDVWQDTMKREHGELILFAGCQGAGDSNRQLHWSGDIRYFTSTTVLYLHSQQ